MSYSAPLLARFAEDETIVVMIVGDEHARITPNPQPLRVLTPNFFALKEERL
jgi:hypothetical protein